MSNLSMTTPVGSVEPSPVEVVGPPPVTTFVPPPRKSGKLKPVKTTRNMNPSSGNTMKYIDKDFLEHPENIVVKKGVNTRSSVRSGDLGGVVEEMEIVDEVGIKKGDKNVLVNSGEDTEMFWGPNGENEERGKGEVGDKKVEVASGSKGVGDNSVAAKSDNSSKPSVVKNIVKNIDKGNQGKGSSEGSPMPVPFTENPVFNPKVANGSKPRSPVKVSFGGEKRPGMFKVSSVDASNGIKSVSNFEVGEGSGVKDEQMKDSEASSKKPFSFVKALTGDNVSGNNRLKFVEGLVNSKGKEVADMDPIVESGSAKWSRTLIGHFVGYHMSHRELLGNLRRMWRPYQFSDVMMNNSGLYFCNFNSVDGMQTVLENGPWFVDNKPFFVQKWEPGICLSKPEVTKVPVWAKIFNVPLEAWNVDGISRIASRLGIPIIMDRITTEMCEKTYGRASFARVLVEVDSSKELLNEVEIYYKSIDRSMVLEVEYPWKPPVCENCKVFGHILKNCIVKKGGDSTKPAVNHIRATNTNNASNASNDGWTNVVNRRGGYSRGGFSNSGRGSYNGGRGNGVYGGRGNGAVKQGVQNNKSDQVNDSSKPVVQETKEDKSKKVNEVKKKVVVPSDKKSTPNEAPKKVNMVHEVTTGNRFGVLVNEGEKETSEKKKKFIDVIVESGVVVTEEDKKKWSAEELKYYEEKSNSMNVDPKSQESIIKHRIDEIQESIAAIKEGLHETATKVAKKRIVDECGGKKNNVAFGKFYEQAVKKESDKVVMLAWERDKLRVDLFVYLGMSLTDEVKATWSEDMVEYYDDALENIYQDRINGHYNDVEGAPNATAEFVSKNEMSNVHDVSMAEMQGGVAADPSSFQ